MSASCGACNLCCKLLAVPDINKPARMLCWWTNIHGGCQRQKDKETDPKLLACAQFECVWLASQTHSDETKRLGKHMRPDYCHVVIGPQDPTDDTLIYVQVDPSYPTAWKEPVIQDYLAGIVERGGKIEVIIGDDRVEIS